VARKITTTSKSRTDGARVTFAPGRKENVPIVDYARAPREAARGRIVFEALRPLNRQSLRLNVRTIPASPPIVAVIESKQGDLQ
jgi:hypothetical protein